MCICSQIKYKIRNIRILLYFLVLDSCINIAVLYNLFSISKTPIVSSLESGFFNIFAYVSVRFY
jgi:hypothetical protein